MATTPNQIMFLSKLVQLITKGLGVYHVTTSLDQFTVHKLVQIISRELGVHLVATSLWS